MYTFCNLCSVHSRQYHIVNVLLSHMVRDHNYPIILINRLLYLFNYFLVPWFVVWNKNCFVFVLRYTQITLSDSNTVLYKKTINWASTTKISLEVSTLSRDKYFWYTLIKNDGDVLWFLFSKRFSLIRKNVTIGITKRNYHPWVVTIQGWKLVWN